MLKDSPGIFVYSTKNPQPSFPLYYQKTSLPQEGHPDYQHIP
jgi:hypothetical protein